MAGIGILTFHRCINYGSYWQALCLVEALRQFGAQAAILDHASRRVARAELGCALSPLEPVRHRGDYARYAAKVRRFQAAMAALPLSRPFDLDQPDEMEDFDLVLVGSDEVWNLRHPWYGRHPVFFGEGVRSRRIASYAASFGNYEAEDGLPERWSRPLRGFSARSVRDENSRRLVAAATDEAPDLVLDPCLLCPPRLAPEDGGPDTVVVYGHGFPRWFADEVRRAAHARGWRLASVGYRNDWADAQHLEDGPIDFAQRIAGSRAVVTNFFHGCVFALAHGKPLVATLSAYRSTKLRDLTDLLGAEAHLVRDEPDGTRIPALIGRPLATQIRARIDALRASSAAYLRRVLH